MKYEEMIDNLDKVGAFIKWPKTYKRLSDAARKLDDPRWLVAQWLPKKASGIAMDECGYWHVFKHKPYILDNRWDGNVLTSYPLPFDIPYDGDWRESWTPKPEEPLRCPMCNGEMCPMCNGEMCLVGSNRCGFFFKCQTCSMSSSVFDTKEKAEMQCRSMYKLLAPMREDRE